MLRAESVVCTLFRNVLVGHHCARRSATSCLPESVLYVFTDDRVPFAKALYSVIGDGGPEIVPCTGRK